MDYKPQTAFFSGYRTKKLLKYNSAPFGELREKLRATLLELYNFGYKRFICGMGEGFDLVAAEEVLKFREIKPLVELMAAVPYIGHERSFSMEEKGLYYDLLTKADEVKVLCNNPVNIGGAHLLRNEYMLGESSVLVCYFDEAKSEPRSGTQYNVRHARKEGLRVINLFRC
ncbi:MAG: SLOG family protein [Rikenellaceae bacterium]